MEYNICFILLNFIIEYLICYILKTIYKLQIKNIMLFFLQVFNICNCVVYLFLSIKLYEFIMIKIIINMILSLLIIDSYKPKQIFSFIMISLLLLFSVYGISIFMLEIISALEIIIFNKKLSQFVEIMVFFAILLYIFAVFKSVKYLTRKKTIKHFIRKLSFFAFSKHIEFNGLIDSGNSLYDSKTGLPVVLVSVFALKNYLPHNIYKNITNGIYNDVKIDHYLKVYDAVGAVSKIPIISVSEVLIFNEGECNNFKCAIAMVNQVFEKGDEYSCLLHRDFV